MGVNANGLSNTAPVLPPDVPQYFITPTQDTGEVLYTPTVLGLADVHFANARLGVAEQRRVALLTTVNDGPIAVEWDGSERVELDPSQLTRTASGTAQFGNVPAIAASARSYAAWTKTLQKWLVANEQVTLLKSAALKLTSEPGESERDFRIRLQVHAHELRDEKIAALRAKYSSKLATAVEKVRKAEQAVQREQQQASQAKMDTAISVGGAILGAIFGRGKVGVGTLGKVATASRGAGRAMQQAGDVTRAAESLEAARQQYADLEARLQEEVDALGAAYDAQQESLETTVVKAKAADVHIQLVALCWVPRTRDASGRLSDAWR